MIERFILHCSLINLLTNSMAYPSGLDVSDSKPRFFIRPLTWSSYFEVGKFTPVSKHLPSGKRLQNTMENHYFQWVNPLFLWPFSIAMLVITRGYLPVARISESCLEKLAGVHLTNISLLGGSSHLVSELQPQLQVD